MGDLYGKIGTLKKDRGAGNLLSFDATRRDEGNCSRMGFASGYCERWKKGLDGIEHRYLSQLESLGGNYLEGIF